LFDHLRFEPASSGIELTCSHPSLACDSTNLVHRAADAFLRAAQIDAGGRFIKKRIPLAAAWRREGNAATIAD
jgi:4-diphosphocytidyl-2C-methyl-D-erythritol kinase